MRIAFFSSLIFLNIFLSINDSLALDNKLKPNLEVIQNNKKIEAKEIEVILNIEKMNKGLGRFEQKKYFKIMSKPFITTGAFAYLNQNLIWKTETPVQNAFILKQGKSYTVSSTGNIQQQQNSAQFGEVMQDVLQFNFERLDDSFEFYSTESPGCINLVSKNKQFNSIFLQIEICGNQSINQISLFEKNDNLTVITFEYLNFQEVPPEWLPILNSSKTAKPEFILNANNNIIETQ